MNTYTSAQSRITLDASGVYVADADGASTLTRGVVTLNAVDGTLRSITVADPVTRKAVTRVKGAALRNTSLSFPTKRDTATLAGFTR